jgi:phage gp36-like protein
LEGTLIGDGRAFVDHIRERYNKTLTITKENQKNRAKLNVDENEEKMRKKKEGDTLGVKIINHLERMKKKGVS